MSRNISDIVDFEQYLVRKERGIFITPAQVTANLDAGQMDALEEWYKLYGETGTIHDAIKKLRVYYQFTSDSAGFVTYPSDYIHLIGSAFTVTGSTVNQIYFYNEDEFVNALNSQLRAVSLSNPIAIDTSTGFSIYPQSTQIGFFNYIKRPATPVYGYTQSGRTITYDPNTSTQLDWSDAYINHIIAKSLKYAGLNMGEQEISQFAEIYDKQT